MSNFQEYLVSTRSTFRVGGQGTRLATLALRGTNRSVAQLGASLGAAVLVLISGGWKDDLATGVTSRI